MNLIRKSKFFLISLTLLVFLAASLGCSYKPAYLQKSGPTKISERWKVETINPAKLSEDERQVYEKMGPPNYVRFFRHLSVEREKVYEWIYAEPIQFFTFMNGKKVDYVVMDENPTSLNESQQRVYFWTAIVGSSVALTGGLIYLLMR